MKNSHYETHNIAKEHLPFIFHHDKYTRMDAKFSNWHENIEIIRHVSGEGYVLIDSMRYEIKDGSIIIINANSMHAFGTESTVEYDCLIPDNIFLTENGIDIAKMSFSTVVNSKNLADKYTTATMLIDAFRNEPRELDVAKIRSAILALAIELCENHRENLERHADPSAEKIKEVITYIYNNYNKSDSSLTLDEISKQAKMSKYYLCREFKSLTGNTVFEFINIIRCREAKRKIREGLSVSEAAYSVGFESLAYFTKKFKRINGKLPSEYKKKA